MKKKPLVFITYVIIAGIIATAILTYYPTKGPSTTTPNTSHLTTTPSTEAQPSENTTTTTQTMTHPFYPNKYSRYGGWLGLKTEGTGFFRVEVIDGKYWLVDPEGYAFISKGVNHVDYLGDFSPALKYSPYHVNILKKYGSVSEWVRVTVERLLEWGFNTVGAWSSRELYQYMPYTINLNILGDYGFNWTSGRMPDVFSPGFEQYMERKAYFNCRPLANDSLLLGYFLDNELRWGPDWRSGTHLLDDFMSLPSTSPGKKVAVEVIEESYGGDISKLNAEWGTNFVSFNELLGYRGRLPDTQAIGEARLEFVRRYAERYFSVAAEKIRKYDPNHLILGIRFAGIPDRTFEEEVFKIMAEYVDVISINLYNVVDPPKEKLERIHQLTARPIMITEFSFRARDSGLPNTRGAGLTFDTQEERANATYRFVSGLLLLDFVIGYHWFQYYDQPKEGRFDGENSNYGLVKINDEPYDEMINMFKRLNTVAEEIHLGRIHP